MPSPLFILNAAIAGFCAAGGSAGDRLQELDDPRLATLSKPFRLAQLTDALTRLGL
jgi:hypothetical protein